MVEEAFRRTSHLLVSGVTSEPQGWLMDRMRHMLCSLERERIRVSRSSKFFPFCGEDFGMFANSYRIDKINAQNKKVEELMKEYKVVKKSNLSSHL
jgi:hypothetical protein